MTVELRVLSGARAGVSERFEKSVIAVGRHAMSDLRMDPQADLDVSTRHAELRGVDGVWTIYDLTSTNGTFVNGSRVMADRRLANGDVVSLGANGPRVEVHLLQEAAAGVVPAGAPATAIASQAPPLQKRKTPLGLVLPRRDTMMRVAEAVHLQTASMRKTFFLTIGGLIAAGAIGFFFWQRQASTHEGDLLARLAAKDSLLVAEQLRGAAARPGDTAYASALKAERKQVAALRAQIAAGATDVVLPSQTRADFSAVSQKNDAAVAMLVSDLDGTMMAGTAFGITASGMLVTNRHVVSPESGPAKRIGVAFANTKGFAPAHIVRVSTDDDLAIIQMDRPGTYPVVAGVSRSGALARVGNQVASIGFPLANDTPMQGTGLSDLIPKTTMTLGTVSKTLDDVLQMDSFSGVGASGSPVFDASGKVVGVIYGGARESHGRIVYAVSSNHLATFLGSDGAAIVR